MLKMWQSRQELRRQERVVALRLGEKTTEHKHGKPQNEEHNPKL